VPFRQFL